MQFLLLKSVYNYLTVVGNRILIFALVIFLESFTFFLLKIVIYRKMFTVKKVLLVLETSGFHSMLTLFYFKEKE